jgi:hypothetical protein
VEASTKASLKATRNQWLSELNQAVDEAQCLAWRIGVVEGRNALALELYVQLELIRAEAEALRGQDFSTLRDAPSSAFPSPRSDASGNFAAAGKGLQK